jgi:CheY-like chemotaxis protein/HPt (histidine-containing phosphotransfer) domain-containing protein
MLRRDCATVGRFLRAQRPLLLAFVGLFCVTAGLAVGVRPSARAPVWPLLAALGGLLAAAGVLLPSVRRSFLRDFTASSRREAPPPAAAAREIAASPAQESEAKAARSLRVLVVEDNAVNQRVLSMQLERVGHHVHLATNGIEALEALEQQPFDLVLMDLQMPEMDGVRTTRLLRAREKATGGRVAVVAVTANTLPEERRRCMSAGMDDYLTKPIRAADLYAAIARVLGPATRAVPEAVPPAEQRLPPGNGWLEAVQGMGFPPTAAARLAKTFLEEVPGRMDRLRESLAAGDAAGVRAAAHALKGTLMVFSAHGAIAAAGTLEEQGQRQQLEGAAVPLAVLESEVAALLAGMTAYLRSS